MAVMKEEQINQNGTFNIYKHHQGKIWPQILAVFAVSLGPLTNGMLFSWSSPFALVITKDKENYNITEEEASYFIIFHPLGMICASLFLFKMAEWLGRKKSVLLIAIPHLIGWIIVIFAKSKWEFYASRFVVGMGDAAFFSFIPPYVGEITTPTVRGYFGNLPLFVFYGGSVIITVLGSYCDVKTTAYICIGIPVLFVILVSTIPESPYQLIKDRKHDQARKSIKWLIRKSDVEDDFLSTKADVERQMSERGKWKDLLKIDSNRKALRAGVFLRFSQQFCGVTVFGTYTQTLFEKAGGNLTPQYSSMIFVGLIWILNLLCSASVEKFGRKLSYFYSLMTSGTILVILAVYFFLDQYDLANLDQLSWFPVAAMMVYVFTYSFGLGIVPTLMLGELFSASIKSKGLSVLTSTFGIAVFISTNLFNLLSSYLGLYAPFLLYGISCLLSTILTLRWVPETKGKTLEEIQQALKK